jgi:hypothetical protein
MLTAPSMQSPTATVTGNKQKLVPYFLLVASPLLIFSRLWIAPFAMSFDIANYFLPVRYLIGESLKQHQFPWWNPYSALGTPMHADPQSGVYYPITWVIGYILGYDFYTINLEYLLHLVVAGCGMYLLLRGLQTPVPVALLLAWSYQFSGFFVNNAQHLSWIISAAWVPFFFHYYRSNFLKANWRDGMRASLSLFMMTTGGYPAFLLILIYIVTGHYLFFIIKNLGSKRRKAILQSIKALFLVFAFYALITLPYIFSFTQVITLMTRGEPLVRGSINFQAFTPPSVISFLFPAATLSDPMYFKADMSMTNAYIGLVALIFMIVGLIRNPSRPTIIISIVSFLFLLISFGDAFPLWPFLFDHVPLFNRMRFPAAFRLFVIMGMLVVAAHGLKRKCCKGPCMRLLFPESHYSW